MRPQQIRIAAKIARAPEDNSRPTPGTRIPEVARIENGEIEVSPV
jgi:septum formation inhibitor MinC